MHELDEKRHEGLERWRNWLTEFLSGHGLVGELQARPGATGAGWWIGFEDNPTARLLVAEDALAIREHDFNQLIERLEQSDWLERLRANRPGGLRIHAHAELEELGPEGSGKEDGTG